MQKKQIEHHLKQLEENVFHCLQTVSKYSYDQEIPEDDFSKEYLYYELFYSMSNYERGINNLEIESNLKDRFASLHQLAVETAELEDDNFFDRLNTFGIQYFSDKRYNAQINKFIEKINFNSLEEVPDDARALLENTAYSLFKIRDEISQLNQDSSLFITLFNQEKNLDYYNQLEEKISAIHSNNIWLWSIFDKIIEANRKALLIPATYIWWYQLNNLNEKSVEMAFQEAIKKNRVLELMNTVIPPEFEEFRNTIPDTYGWIVENSPQSAAYLSIISQPAVKAYKDWSESAAKPTPSDHQILDNIFRNVPGIDNAIIEDLIDAVLLEDMDQEKKNNILATAYFIIGKSKEALKLLSNEE